MHLISVSRSTQVDQAAEIVALPCACSNLRRASRAVTQLYNQELRKVDLEATQFTLLLAISRRGPITQGRLGARLGLDSTTLTRSLAPLQKKGWIESLPGDDRREKHLRLTTSGRRQLRRALPHWERAQRRLRRTLGSLDWDRLQGTLAQVAQAARSA
jgi:DNA-binding MarR family transcriptional regulator